MCLRCSVEAIRHYSSHWWAGFKQWQKIGAQVRKGEKGSLILIYKQRVLEEANDATGETSQRLQRFGRAEYVFHASQVDGWTPPPLTPAAPFNTDAVDTFVANTGAVIEDGGDQAYYSPTTDIIHMPDRNRFRDTVSSTAGEHIAQTLLHETVHWSGGPKRLNRTFARFGSKAYSAEELCAELGAAYLMADLGIAPSPRADHAAYIKEWIVLLGEHRTALASAAGQATKAVAYLHGLQPEAKALAA